MSNRQPSRSRLEFCLLACTPLMLSGCVAAPLAQLALSQAAPGAAGQLTGTMQPCPPAASAITTAAATDNATQPGTAGCSSAVTTFARGLGQALQQFTGSATMK
ncbi:MAG TPA: hypothetical protein VN702_08935 [Acetobacteraceae bacterium]|nr:hypothetical protein [Acetobacteraceae bacterium]